MIIGNPSLRTRITLVLLVGLIVSNLIGFFIYTGDRTSTLLQVTGTNNAARIVSIIANLERLSPTERQNAICSLSGPGLTIALTAEPVATRTGLSQRAQNLRDGLRDFLGTNNSQSMAVMELNARDNSRHTPFLEVLNRCGTPSSRMMQDMMNSRSMMQMSPQSRRMMQHWVSGDALAVSYQFADGRWLNILTQTPKFVPIWRSRFLLAILLVAGAITLLSIWAVRRSTEPLALFAWAAERLGRDVNAPDLPEDGPGEVSKAARAFNKMQQRLRRLITDRTRILAAVSHDLRTPITRLRLRAEFVEDDEQREKMLEDLAQMEAMISATLAFARLDSVDEATKPLDLAGLISSVCDDTAELGKDVRYDGPERALLTGRPIALRRVLQNLVDNAVKYGERAVVRFDATGSAESYLITVEDQGPGIAEENMARVFEPFHRVETSRNRETGGVGLGLAVVRSIIQGHGGNVTLANRKQGGLRVEVELPKNPPGK